MHYIQSYSPKFATRATGGYGIATDAMNVIRLDCFEYNIVFFAGERLDD